MSRPSKVVTMLMVAVLLMLAASWAKAEWETWLDTPLVMNEPEVRCVVVRPGDTVWAIASREIEGNHAGKKVIQLRELNPWIGKDNVIRPGQKVRVP